ncbi:MAG TPA: FAD:protein FMN transferase [Acidobacteriota bacterium]|nr:FAD:protein FMN transferase [Acidobacteriota bacterium]
MRLSSALVLTWISIGFLASQPAAQGGREGPQVVVERQVYLMGTRCRLAAVAADRESAIRGLESLLTLLEASEGELSTWRPNSRLSLLNQQPLFQPLALHPGLCRLFEELRRWHYETGGAFDPFIGRLLEAWDIRGRGHLAQAPELEAALQASGLRHIRFDPQACTVAKEREVLIDAGAFGKGEALDRAFAHSQKLGLKGWMADLGGQIGVWGNPPRGLDWDVRVAHPRHRQQTLTALKLAAGSLAVSGGSERDLTVDGEAVSHIIDPRTGRPVSFRGSTVVWHQSGLASDVLSTALYVMGTDQGSKWAQERGIAACFLIPGNDGDRVSFRCSARFREVFGHLPGIRSSSE